VGEAAMTWTGLGVGLGHRITHGLVGGAPVIGHIRTIRGDICAPRAVAGDICAARVVRGEACA